VLEAVLEGGAEEVNYHYVEETFSAEPVDIGDA
jgi:hypothetical protein